MPSNPYKTTISVSSSSSLPVSPVYIPDYSVRPFSLTVGTVPTSSGSTAAFTYNIEYTIDNTGAQTIVSTAPGGQNIGSMSFISTALTWWSSLATGVSSLATSISIGFPVSGIRTNITAGTSNCSVVMTVLQSG